MAIHQLTLSLPTPPKLNSGSRTNYGFLNPRPSSIKRRLGLGFRPRSSSGILIINSLETKPNLPRNFPIREEYPKEPLVLLDVGGMMCGGCVSRVKSVLAADERVDSVVVNMLTETAAIRLKPEVMESEVLDTAAESLVRRVTECGFSAKRRVSGLGVGENVRKWKEMMKKKEELLVKSRNRVAFAWTLVALCCGSHASHILHSLGIHIAHGKLD